MGRLSIFLLVLVLGCISLASGDDCSTAENTWDPKCPAKTPFCKTTSSSLTASRTCSACRTDCDCSLSQFCSDDTTGGSAGSCIDFAPSGKSCAPVSTAQQTDSSVDGSVKCSMTWQPPAPLPMAINYLGACIEGTCRMCSVYSSECAGGEYLGPSRTCVFPGVWQTYHSEAWSPGAYFEEPIRVWLAVFFVFIVFMCCAQVCGCAHKTKKNYMK